MASKHAADLTDQAKEKFDEVSGKAQSGAKKVKKDAEDKYEEVSEKAKKAKKEF